MNLLDMHLEYMICYRTNLFTLLYLCFMCLACSFHNKLYIYTIFFTGY